MQRCTNCSRSWPAEMFVSEFKAVACNTCARCRASHKKSKSRVSRPIHFQIVYYRQDQQGLACLNCPLPLGCVYEAGTPYPVAMCPLRKKELNL